MAEQMALIHGPVEIHTASICPRGGVDLTITVPEEIGRQSLGELQSPEGMRAVARVILAAADESEAKARCKCDGAAYEFKEHPFLVNDDCPYHGRGA
ncbi:Uncharacterised protein [Mycobacteroides abscessus subsp. abscessus]|uniref:hypothetical protein n=1 Tax=Mycobacteroides abscessus TaxID=36809 RepID=UPI00092B43DD|nr:hypothetical protein [Mycobacteroides abscessus]SHU67827.1 Uncharacterised protein [Mycobacteroides abscessus subsp. abscessus]